MSKGPGGMLSPYRVLDLTDEKGLLCGKLLGDLGADVIKIEKPGGDLARRIGPFYKDIPDPNKSLFWWAFNTNKKGITLDIEKSAGQDIFRKIAETADIIIESFPPGYLNALGLGYSALSQLNSSIIMTSITPFGQTGPYRNNKATDIIAMAMGGLLYVSGDPDRPPVRISFPNAYLLASAEAGVGTMMAIYFRNRTGAGQQVDISAQRSVLTASYDSVPWWVTNRVIYQRQGVLRARPQTGVVFRQTWPCKDGYVTFYYFGGSTGAAGNRGLAEWMNSEGIACQFLKEKDWDSFDWSEVTQEEVDLMEEVTAKFFTSHTKSELYKGAVERGIMLYPVATTKDILESRQLATRGYWIELEHPELGTTITYPGAFFKTSQTPYTIWRRAPLIGEHNQAIYEKELGLSKKELSILKKDGII